MQNFFSKKSTQRALQGQLESTSRTLREHLSAEGTRTLNYLRHSGTRRTLGHLGTGRALRFSCTREQETLKALYLAGSLVLDDYCWDFKDSDHLRAIFSKIDEIEVFFIKINLNNFFAACSRSFFG